MFASHVKLENFGGIYMLKKLRGVMQYTTIIRQNHKLGYSRVIETGDH